MFLYNYYANYFIILIILLFYLFISLRIKTECTNYRLALQTYEPVTVYIFK